MLFHRRGLALAFIAAATLTAEIALTRLLSVGLFHHFAFVVVSTAMFGTAGGGLLVVLRPGWRRSTDDAIAARASAAYAVALPLTYAVSQQVPLEPLALDSNPLQAIWLALVYGLLAAPFAAGGVAVAATLDRHAADAPRLYAADLAGASLGCFIALGALYLGPSGLYLSSMLALGAAWQFGLGVRLCLAGAVGLGVAAATSPLPLHISATKITRSGQPFAEVLANPVRTLDTAWSPLGRTDLVRFRGGRRVMIDAGVAAVRVPPLRATYIESDATLPYTLRPRGRVLIIGAGAGWEVGEALQFGATAVDAVEINPQVAAHAPAPVRGHPNVRWHLTDGRTFLHQTQALYDAIVLNHTISNAATAAGAMRLAEDYLLTVEAFQAMRSRLKDRGHLLLTRPLAQIPILVRTLERAGIDPATMVAWTEAVGANGFYAAVLVRAGPWPEAALEQVRTRLRQRRLRLLFDPTTPPSERNEALRIEGPPAATERAAIETLVPTDDRPFFHQHRRLTDFAVQRVFGLQHRARLALEDTPLAEASLLLLLVQTTVMAAVILLLPLVVDRRDRRPEAARIAVYFSSLGLGFMLVEVALVQRLGLLLGSPTLAFAVVFAGLLAGTAAGSRLAESWPYPRHAPGVAAAAVVVLLVALPVVVDTALPLPGGVRIGLALLVVGAVGLALGLPFPTGLRALSDRPGAAAWALAFNGVASVAGTTIALLVGAQLGLTASTGLALIAYGLAWRAMPTSSHR